MFLVVIILPLISFLTLISFGRLIGAIGSVFISCINLILSFIFSVFLFWNISHVWSGNIVGWTWFNISGFSIDAEFGYDGLTSIMFIVVTVVSSLVHCYSSVYMYTDPFLVRFMSYISLFTFFMLVLVSSSNFLVLFLGWEGVGLCSYLLIGFWHTRVQAGKAATKAFLINKVGDLFLLTGIGFLFTIFHTVNFSTISALVAYMPTDIIEIVVFFLLIGAVGKSAQVGLHTWLPDAMEGPTPVSALIHAATMVTAGVFLLIRCSPILEYAPNLLYIIAMWGGITALFSGTIGAVQNDIKKIIAYSTCSQLGYMVLACGLSLYNVGFFHLFNHAFFKALLFLSAGSIIHVMLNEQDIRKMGGLGSLSPFVYVSVVIGSLALAGFPFLAGFYSKDIIIETSNIQYWVSGQFLYWLSVIAAMLTMYYSIRLLYLVFINSFGGFKQIAFYHNKVTSLEFLVLGILGLLSLTSGYYFKDLFFGFGSPYFVASIWILPLNWSTINLEFIPPFIKLVPVVVGFVSLLIALHLYDHTFSNRFVYSNFLTIWFESCKWFYNELVNGYLVFGGLVVSRHSFEQYEKRVLEYHGLTFSVKLISFCGY